YVVAATARLAADEGGLRGREARQIRHASWPTEHPNRVLRASNERTGGGTPAVSLLVAGDAIGELAEDVEVAVVPGSLPDQVRDDVPQRERLAGVFVRGHCFCVPVAGSNDVVGVGCLGGVLVE